MKTRGRRINWLWLWIRHIKKGQGGRASDCDWRMVGHEMEKNPEARSTIVCHGKEPEFYSQVYRKSLMFNSRFYLFK